MIKANEIRVGNIFIGYDDKIIDWKIQDFSLVCNGVEIDEIIKSPLVLSEKILLNVGFEIVNDSGDSKDFSIIGFDYYVGIDHENLRLDFVTKNGCYCVLYDDERLQYLHQLQNLYYSLRGQELNTSELTKND